MSQIAMTYELTDEAKERFTWIEQRRIQLAQFLMNVAEILVMPDVETDEE